MVVMVIVVYDTCLLQAVACGKLRNLQLVHKINVVFKSLTVMNILILHLHPASNSQIIRIGNYPFIWSSLNYSYNITLALLQKNLVGGNSLH